MYKCIFDPVCPKQVQIMHTLITEQISEGTVINYQEISVI